ncbi:hypothetical protein DSECCO2_274070 [anaerobic digester metagenome]
MTRSRVVASDTGLSVHEVVEVVRPALEAAGIQVVLREEEHDGEEELEGNGRDLFTLLERVREGDLYCRARSRREEIAARRHPLAEDELPAGHFTEFMIRKAILLAVEGED